MPVDFELSDLAEVATPAASDMLTLVRGVGAGANKIIRYDNLVAGLGGTGGIDASQIRTRSVSSATPLGGDVLAWNPVSAAWEPSSFFVSVRSYGAVGNGSTDDTAAIQAAVDAAVSIGAAVYFPPGLYKLSGSIFISDVRGFNVLGAGGLSSFLWDGNGTDPMFIVGDAANTTFAKFRVIASSSAPLAEVFRIENDGSGSIAPMFNRFSDIWIDGTDSGVGIGFRGKLGAGGNANTDFMFFENCHVLNYSHSGWTIEANQMHGWKMINCHAVAGTGGKYAVSGGGTAGTLGTFFWDGGFVGNNTEADFFVGNIASLSLPTEIANLSSEGSKRFLVNGPLGIVSRIKVRNVRWSGDAIHADGFAVKLHAAGPYDFDNCTFQGEAGDSVKILWETSQSPIEPSFNFENSTILGTETTLAGAFPDRAPTSMQGSSLADTDGITTLRLNTLSINAGNQARGGFQTLNELTTIAAAATTDTAIQIPAKVILMSVSVLVDTAIPTAATFIVTGTTSGTTFNTAAVPTGVNNSDPGTAAGAYYNATAQTIRITPNLTPGAATGKVRVCVVYYQSTPPTS